MKQFLSLYLQPFQRYCHQKVVMWALYFPLYRARFIISLSFLFLLLQKIETYRQTNIPFRCSFWCWIQWWKLEVHRISRSWDNSIPHLFSMIRVKYECCFCHILHFSYTLSQIVHNVIFSAYHYKALFIRFCTIFTPSMTNPDRPCNQCDYKCNSSHTDRSRMAGWGQPFLLLSLDFKKSRRLGIFSDTACSKIVIYIIILNVSLSFFLSLCLFVCPVAVTFALVVFRLSVYTFWKVLIWGKVYIYFLSSYELSIIFFIKF